MSEVSAFKSGKKFIVYICLLPGQTGQRESPSARDKQPEGHLSADAVYPQNKSCSITDQRVWSVNNRTEETMSGRHDNPCHRKQTAQNSLLKRIRMDTNTEVEGGIVNNHTEEKNRTYLHTEKDITETVYSLPEGYTGNIMLLEEYLKTRKRKRKTRGSRPPYGGR